MCSEIAHLYYNLPLFHHTSLYYTNIMYSSHLGAHHGANLVIIEKCPWKTAAIVQHNTRA